MARILTCLDNSIYAQSCAALAQWAAARSGASVELLNILGADAAPADFGAATALAQGPDLLAQRRAGAAEHGRRIEQQAGELVEALAADLRKAGLPGASARVERGGFLDTLLANSGGADLVVIGKRGEAADFLTLRLGSNMERAAHACDKPVLVAARAFRPIARALIAFDGSQNARDAVALAAGSPLLKGLTIDVVRVGAADQAADEALEDAAGLLRRAGLAATPRRLDGAPERAIPAFVAREGVDLLVMGAPSHSRLHAAVLGSTTSALLRSCVIPALLLR